MENWKVRDAIAVIVGVVGGVTAVMSPIYQIAIVLGTGFIALLIIFLWPEEYEEEGIHFLSQEEKRLIEEVRKRKEVLMKFREAAIKSGEAIPIKVKKRRWLWDKYLPDKTKWP